VIGAIAAAVLLVGGGTAAYISLSRNTSSTPSTPVAGSSSAAPAPTTSLSAANVRVVPTTVLPTDQQVQQATLLSLSRHGDVDTRVYPDSPTDPPTCTLVDNVDGASMAGQALSLAGVLYADQPGDDYRFSGYVSVAVFDSADAAAATLPKITDTVKACTMPYTIPSSAKPDKPAKPWTISDVKTAGNQITWLNTQQSSSGSPWKCGKAFRVQANVMVTAMLCDQNPSDSAAKLIDAVIVNINAAK